MMEKSVSAGQIVDNLSAITDVRRIGRRSALNFVGDISRIPAIPNTMKNTNKKHQYCGKNRKYLDEFRYNSSCPERDFNENILDERNYVYDFVTAKCRLLVNEHADLTEASVCPDTYISWSSIVEVRYPQTESTKCPICLSPPIAPRMGPCGHIYCWSCVYHYIGYENDLNSKKCAVCNVFLRRNELNRVHISSVCIPLPGNYCEFSLIRRRKDCMFPTKIDSPIELISSFPREDSPASIFSRISITNSTEMTMMLQKDKGCLEAYLSECRMDVEMEYIIPTLNELILAIDMEMNSTKLIDEPSSTSFLPSQCKASTLKQIYTYYEDVNGLDIYLHGVNWRCLTTDYEENELPEHITGEVLQVECYTMTAALRRRYRFLGHLPIGRSFYFVELDLRPPLVSIHTLFRLSDMLTSRSLNREKKKWIEKSLSRAKEEAENKIQSLSLGSRLSAPINLNTVPTEDDFMPLPTTVPIPVGDSRFRRSFAVVSALGASSFVDRHRVATFSPNESAKKGLLFDPSSDAWPALGATQQLPIHPTESSWVSLKTILHSESTSPSSLNTLNEGEFPCLFPSQSKKNRKTRRRNPTNS